MFHRTYLNQRLLNHWQNMQNDKSINHFSSFSSHPQTDSTLSFESFLRLGCSPLNLRNVGRIRMKHVWMKYLNMFEHVWTSRFQDQKDITFTLHQQQQMAQSQLGPPEEVVMLYENVQFWCAVWEWIPCDVTLPLYLLERWLRRQWCDLVWSSSKRWSGWRGRKGPPRAVKSKNWPAFFRAWKH